MSGSPAHLIRRFFDVLTARPLNSSEREAVAGWLGLDAAGLFFAQDSADQRHTYHAALTVIAAGVRDREVLAAALLHDVGKRHARLGVVGRSLASILIGLGLPLTERMTGYRDHGMVGARELGAIGAPSLAIDFALHHQGERPVTIEPRTWDLLIAADQPPKPTTMLRGRITSKPT